MDHKRDAHPDYRGSQGGHSALWVGGALCGKAVGIGLTSPLYECNLREVNDALGGECPSFR